jgi:hypothetical protein
MKSSSHKSTFISAYPLKALNLPEEEYQSEVRLWSQTGNQPSKDVRVFPMVNPYREKDFTPNLEDNTSTK